MRGTGFVPDLLLERYRLGELPASEAAVLREKIAADEVLRGKLAALDRSDAAILAACPPARFAEVVHRRGAAEEAAEGRDRRRRGGSSGWRRPIPALAAGALMLVAGGWLLRGALVAPGATLAPAGDRSKGGAVDLLLYRKGGEPSVERLRPGALARAQDVVQIAYQAGGRRFGVILSIDGRGVVTRHLPVGGDQAAELQGGGAVALTTAYRLDDAPRVERFYLVAANEPFSVSAVLTAARRTGLEPLATDRLPLDERFAQASFLLRKE